MNKMPSTSSLYKSVQSSAEGSRAQEKKWMHRKCHACVYWAKLNWNCWQLQMKPFLLAPHTFIKDWTINSSALYRMPAWLLLTWWNASLPGSASWRWAARRHPQEYAALPWLLLHAQKGPAINPQTFGSSQNASVFSLCCGSLDLSHSAPSVKVDQIICMCVHSPGWNLCCGTRLALRGQLDLLLCKVALPWPSSLFGVSTLISAFSYISFPFGAFSWERTLQRTSP